MVLSGKVQKKSMKLKFSVSTDNIKHSVAKGNNALSFQNLKKRKRNKRNRKRSQSSKLAKGNMECKEQQLETGLSAKTNNSQNEPSDEVAIKILTSESKSQKKNQLSKVAKRAGHKGFVVWKSNEETVQTSGKVDEVEPLRDRKLDLPADESNNSVSLRDRKLDLPADESNNSVSSFNINSNPLDTEKDFCADECNNSVSSFNIDSNPLDDEEEKDGTEKRYGIDLSAEAIAELEEVESRTIFVGNLPKTVKWHEVQKWFSRFGYVDCVGLNAQISDLVNPLKGAVVKKPASSRPSIHAYIKYKNIQSATNALVANGTIFDDHILRVDRAKREKYDEKKTVFVGNLPNGIDENTLIDFFLKCGEIERVRVVRFNYPRLRDHFGFVHFKCSCSVQKALELDGEVLEGKQLKVTNYNQKANNHHLSSKFKNTMNIPSSSRGKFSSKKGHITEETGEKKKGGSHQNPRQQKGKIIRGNKYKDHHLSSKLKNTMSIPSFSRGKFSSKKGHIKEETGEKKNWGSYQNPRQQKGKIIRGNKYKDHRLSSKLKNTMNIPSFSRGKFSSNKGHIKEVIGEKKNRGSYQNPKQQKDKIIRENKFKDQ